MQEAISWAPPTGTLGALSRAGAVRAEALQPRQGELERRASGVGARPSLVAALRGVDVAVIAEVKRRSPSRGDIAPGLDAATQAGRYAAGGAAALSILTEPDRFGGCIDDLADAATRVAIPLVKKDFNVHALQILEAAAYGASGVLLIARALQPAALAALAHEARELGIEPLVEIRSERELESALAAGARVIGVNVRDLETLELDANVAERLLPLVPAECVAVWESGVRSVADVARAGAAGADAVLVGSSVSAAADAEQAVRALTGVRRSPRD